MTRWRLTPALVAMGLILSGPAVAADSATVASARSAFEDAARREGANSTGAFTAEVALFRALMADRRVSDAITHLAHAREIVISRMGEDSALAVSLTTTLALHMAAAGDVAGGETLLRNAMARLQASLGAAEPRVGLIKGALGRILADRGLATEAYPLLKAGYEGAVATAGENSQQARMAGDHLLTVTAVLGLRAEAQALLRRLARPPPQGSPEFVALLAAAKQVELLNGEGHPDEAIALGEPLIGRLASRVGADHPLHLTTLMELARAHASLKQWSSAADAMRRYHDGFVRKSGPDDEEALGALAIMGGYQMQDQRPAVRAAGRAAIAEAIERLDRSGRGGRMLAAMAQGNLAVKAHMDETVPSAEVERLLTDAERRLSADSFLGGSVVAQGVNMAFGRRLIAAGRGREAYGRMTRAAAVVRSRAADSRVAASGLDAMAVLTSSRSVFIDQVRAGWMYAHEP